MSNMAFAISEDDVAAVMSKHRANVTSDMIQDAYDALNHDRVEKSALYGNDLDSQTELAYQDIEEQLRELKLI